MWRSAWTTPLARAKRGKGDSLLANEEGTNAVEFALVVPLLVTLLFGIFEFARAVFVQGMLDYAVEQAARCASVASATTCNSTSATASYAAGLTSPLNIPAGDFTASVQSCGNQVAASYNFAFVGTFALIGGKAVLPSSVTLTASSCYPI